MIMVIGNFYSIFNRYSINIIRAKLDINILQNKFKFQNHKFAEIKRLFGQFLAN